MVTFQKELDEDSFPPSSTPKTKSHDVAYMIINKDESCTAYTDLTGKFPLRSSRVNQYVLVGYYYDANCVIVEHLRNRTAGYITQAWNNLHQVFEQSGIAPNTYIMNNETSGEFMRSLKDKGLKYQLVPPNSHPRNLEEWDIQTWNKYFKAGLASVDPNFPLSEWDILIHQTNITLNLLHSSRLNPKMSTYTHIFGKFNFAASPLASSGTKIVTHITPEQRLTWELIGEAGWYVGPSINHYRYVQYYFPRTKIVRICDTVTFSPQQFLSPKST